MLILIYFQKIIKYLKNYIKVIYINIININKIKNVT